MGINYYLFSRADGSVVISNDRNYLFFTETVVKDRNSGSYCPVGMDEIDGIVSNLNTIYDHYKAGGFNEVYLSIIPNPVTILQHTGYNNLIPLIQNHPKLKMKCIDSYSVFMNIPGDYYLRGDTHWNKNGKQTWIDLVNKTLEEN